MIVKNIAKQQFTKKDDPSDRQLIIFLYNCQNFCGSDK